MDAFLATSNEKSVAYDNCPCTASPKRLSPHRPPTSVAKNSSPSQSPSRRKLIFGTLKSPFKSLRKGRKSCSSEEAVTPTDTGRRKSVSNIFASIRSRPQGRSNERKEDPVIGRPKSLSPTKSHYHSDEYQTVLPKRRKSLGDLLGSVSNKVSSKCNTVSQRYQLRRQLCEVLKSEIQQENVHNPFVTTLSLNKLPISLSIEDFRPQTPVLRPAEQYAHGSESDMSALVTRFGRIMEHNFAQIIDNHEQAQTDRLMGIDSNLPVSRRSSRSESGTLPSTLTSGFNGAETPDGPLPMPSFHETNTAGISSSPLPIKLKPTKPVGFVVDILPKCTKEINSTNCEQTVIEGQRFSQYGRKAISAAPELRVSWVKEQPAPRKGTDNIDPVFHDRLEAEMGRCQNLRSDSITTHRSNSHRIAESIKMTVVDMTKNRYMDSMFREHILDSGGNDLDVIRDTFQDCDTCVLNEMEAWDSIIRGMDILGRARSYHGLKSSPARKMLREMARTYRVSEDRALEDSIDFRTPHEVAPGRYASTARSGTHTPVYPVEEFQDLDMGLPKLRWDGWTICLSSQSPRRSPKVPKGPVQVSFPDTKTRVKHVERYENTSKAICELVEKSQGEISNICTFDPQNRIIAAHPKDYLPDYEKLQISGLEVFWLPMQHILAQQSLEPAAYRRKPFSNLPITSSANLSEHLASISLPPGVGKKPFQLRKTLRMSYSTIDSNKAKPGLDINEGNVGELVDMEATGSSNADRERVLDYIGSQSTSSSAEIRRQPGRKAAERALEEILREGEVAGEAEDRFLGDFLRDVKTKYDNLLRSAKSISDRAIKQLEEHKKYSATTTYSYDDGSDEVVGDEDHGSNANGVTALSSQYVYSEDSEYDCSEGSTLVIERDQVRIRDQTSIPAIDNPEEEATDPAVPLGQQPPARSVCGDEAGRIDDKRKTFAPIDEVATTAAEVADSAALLDKDDLYLQIFETKQDNESARLLKNFAEDPTSNIAAERNANEFEDKKYYEAEVNNAMADFSKSLAEAPVRNTSVYNAIRFGGREHPGLDIQNSTVSEVVEPDEHEVSLLTVECNANGFEDGEDPRLDTQNPIVLEVTEVDENDGSTPTAWCESYIGWEKDHACLHQKPCFKLHCTIDTRIVMNEQLRTTVQSTLAQSETSIINTFPNRPLPIRLRKEAAQAGTAANAEILPESDRHDEEGRKSTRSVAAIYKSSNINHLPDTFQGNERDENNSLAASPILDGESAGWILVTARRQIFQDSRHLNSTPVREFSKGSRHSYPNVDHDRASVHHFEDELDELDELGHSSTRYPDYDEIKVERERELFRSSKKKGRKNRWKKRVPEASCLASDGPSELMVGKDNVDGANPHDKKFLKSSHHTSIGPIEATVGKKETGEKSSTSKKNPRKSSKKATKKSLKSHPRPSYSPSRPSSGKTNRYRESSAKKKAPEKIPKTSCHRSDACSDSIAGEDSMGGKSLNSEGSSKKLSKVSGSRSGSRCKPKAGKGDMDRTSPLSKQTPNASRCTAFSSSESTAVRDDPRQFGKSQVKNDTLTSTLDDLNNSAGSSLHSPESRGSENISGKISVAFDPNDDPFQDIKGVNFEPWSEESPRNTKADDSSIPLVGRAEPAKDPSTGPTESQSVGNLVGLFQARGTISPNFKSGIARFSPLSSIICWSGGLPVVQSTRISAPCGTVSSPSRASRLVAPGQILQTSPDIGVSTSPFIRPHSGLSDTNTDSSLKFGERLHRFRSPHFFQLADTEVQESFHDEDANPNQADSIYG